jgi:hypothetical protein
MVDPLERRSSAHSDRAVWANSTARPWVRWASTLLLALLLAAGCREGGGSKPLTRDQYAAKADAICAKYEQQLKVPKGISSMPELAAAIDKTSPALAKALDEIRKLKPPADEQAAVDAWLTQIENLEGDVKEIRDKAKSNDMQGVLNALSKGNRHNAKSRQLATQLGMQVCNED